MKKLGNEKSCKRNIPLQILTQSKSFNLSKVYETSINSLGSYWSSYVDIKTYQDGTFYEDKTKVFNIMQSSETLNNDDSIEKNFE